MGNYLDGFVIPIPKDKIEDYRKIAELASVVWKEHGALEYYEAVGDDLEAKGDDLEAKDLISFPELAKTSPDETVIFAYIVYESREHRDAVNAKVMADPRMTGMMNDCEPVFDCKRMAYGGFKVIVKA